MLTAASLGVRAMMYPGSVAPQQVPLVGDGPIMHGDPSTVIDGQAAEPEPPERMTTDAPPSDAEELSLEEPTPKVSEPIYHILKVTKRGQGADLQYFAETKEGPTLFTTDGPTARACLAAAKDGLPREIPTEGVQVAGKFYRQVIEVTAAGKLAL